MDDLIMDIVGHYMDVLIDGSGCEQVHFHDD